jgi:putative dehydrogenase
MVSASTTVGMIGTGLMGSAMTQRLIAQGFKVEGYDPSPDAQAKFAAIGGRPHTSLAALAASVERAVISVFNSDQVEDVVEGKDGVASLPHAARKLRLLVNTSTCEPDRMAALAQRAAAKGVGFMELPLSGSSGQVVRGEALGLVGDNGGDLERAKDIVAAISPRFVPMGPVGNGSKTKLAINHILALNRAAVAEGLVFADRIGLPLEAFLEAAKASAAYSQVMQVKGPLMVAGDFAPQGRIRQSLKDISMIVAEGKKRGQELPMAEVYRRLMQDGVDAGEGDIDNAGVINAIKRLGKG